LRRRPRAASTARPRRAWRSRFLPHPVGERPDGLVHHLEPDRRASARWRAYIATNDVVVNVTLNDDHCARWSADRAALKHGDLVEVVNQAIGTLANRVRKET